MFAKWKSNSNLTPSTASEKERLITILIDSVEGRIGLEDVVQEITMFENTKSDTTVTTACHQLRHFYADADIRARDQAYDVLMKKNLHDFIEKIRSA
jgi:hypothetical protein